MSVVKSGGMTGVMIDAMSAEMSAVTTDTMTVAATTTGAVMATGTDTGHAGWA